MRRPALLLLALPFALSCASSTTTTPPSEASNSKPVAEQEEPRRALGTQNDVRIDVAVYSDRLTPNTVVPIRWDITNHRDKTILVADLIPNAMYDPDTRTVTVDLGSEIPGENFLPRLIAVRPEERKTFSGSAHVNIAANPASSPWTPKPNGIRVRLNFLDDTTTFAPLIDIKEKAVYDPKLADALFQKWVDNNETVVTNTLPMRWAGGTANEPLTPATDPARAGRGRGRP